MLLDLVKFYTIAKNKKIKSDLTLEEYFKKHPSSKDFQYKHIYPMASAIWSTKSDDIKKMPIQSFINFFNNHGLFKFFNRPQWYTVLGGSKNYVKKIIKNTNGTFEKNTKIIKIKKNKKKNRLKNYQKKVFV